MKLLRSFLVRALACTALLCLLAPASSQADDKLGVYITPKFSMGFMNWQAYGDTDASGYVVKGSNGGGGVTSRIRGAWDFDGGKSNTLWGGALAVGYDFYPRFDLPLRVELEYARYSNASGSSNRSLSSYEIESVTGQAHNEKCSSKRRWSTEADITLQNIQTLLLNAYWDFHNSTNFTPYIGAGVGLAFIQVSGEYPVYFRDPVENVWYTDKSLGIRNNTNFAWQVGLGCSYAFTDTISLDLGYRFMGLGNVESNTVTAVDRTYAPYQNQGVCDINMHAHGEARNIYMHQVNLGLRITF